jgi:Phage tail tube protein
MPIQSGVSTRIAYKFYASGAIADPLVAGLPGATGGQILRRVSSDLNLGRASFQSREVTSHRQVSDYRLGAKTVAGEISGELSPRTYFDFVEAVCRGTAAAEISRSNTEFTSVAADNVASKFTVAASTWVAQGLVVGDVIRFSNLSAAANNDVNYLITSLSGVDAFVTPAPTTMGADTSFTVLRKGKKVMPPLTSHVNRLVAVEHYFEDIDAHELFLENRVASLRLAAPANGMATIAIGLQGRDMAKDSAGNSPYLTGPAAATTTGILASPNGILRVGAANVGTITGFDLGLDLSPTSPAVVGSQLSPEIFLGRANVTGRFSAMLDGFTRVDEYLNESDVAVSLVMEVAGAAPRDFVNIYLPRVRLNKVDIQNQGEEGTLVNCSFQALKRVAATGYDETTIVFQDSAA